MKPYVRIGLLAVLIAVVAAVLPRIVDTREQVHEIRLVAKSMTYYADGSEDPNPTLWLVPGEQVRVTIRNDDRGMSHDFGIPAFRVGTGIVEFGSEKTVTFKVPDNPSAATYICTPHSAMMSGRIFFAK